MFKALGLDTNYVQSKFNKISFLAGPFHDLNFTGCCHFCTDLVTCLLHACRGSLRKEKFLHRHIEHPCNLPVDLLV